MFTRSGDQIEIATFRALRRANSSITDTMFIFRHTQLTTRTRQCSLCCPMMERNALLISFRWEKVRPPLQLHTIIHKYNQSLLIISPVIRRAATWPLVLELKSFLSNNVRMSTVLLDHNSNNCTHSGNVCCCTYMVNNYYDKFRSFSRLYMTLFRHRTCTCLHGSADRFLVSVSTQ